MKCIRIIICIVIVSVLLSACQTEQLPESVPNTEVAEISETTVTEESTQIELPSFDVVPPSFYEAAEGNTLRDKVAKRFNLLKEITWLLPQDVKIQGLSGEEDSYPKFSDRVYIGDWNFSYSTDYHIPIKGPMYREESNTTVENFLSHIDENGIYTGPTDESYLGINSLTAAAYGWMEIDKSLSVETVSDLLPTDKNRIRLVGNYEYFDAKSSKEITEKNGKDVMLEAYKELKVGDILLSFDGDCAFAFLSYGVSGTNRFEIRPGVIEVYWSFFGETITPSIISSTGGGFENGKGGSSFSIRSIYGRLELLYENHFIPLTHEALIEDDQ